MDTRTLHSTATAASVLAAPLPPTGYLRERQILGDRRANPPVPAIIPVSRSLWWSGVRSGRYPRPVRLSARCTAWRVEDIRELIERLARGEGA
jgi:predicted DNA-binding transcriptional regulator AlpA